MNRYDDIELDKQKNRVTVLGGRRERGKRGKREGEIRVIQTPLIDVAYGKKKRRKKILDIIREKPTYRLCVTDG